MWNPFKIFKPRPVNPPPPAATISWPQTKIMRSPELIIYLRNGLHRVESIHEGAEGGVEALAKTAYDLNDAIARGDKVFWTDTSDSAMAVNLSHVVAVELRYFPEDFDYGYRKGV
jgi:hypothetical protein